ncbi:hypothetical protein [Spiroplasma turonicum]|uniref:Uncharacterized protein n=1 Tax=Spiroplasma turonicum TaxID=216946 RepID=A0A0K1P4Z0_9MOLU|nr:hypothetical protein [Spiroplasma turonicum]AKU79376.1 hypothetical protein STURON_00130 [Spiroplasma turonicum]ALX70398.1 hypothetical protein STURO_v1c01290 [Spiroplasma turonicum]
MGFNLNNTVEVTDGNFDLITKYLEEGKTVIASLQKGEKLTESLQTGDMLNGFAKIKLKESKENCGVCACGKTADTLVYLWRE